MKIPELFHNLEYFSPDDYNQFEKFLKSPYFNNLNSLVKIYAILKRNDKLLKEKNYDKLKFLIRRDSNYSGLPVYNFEVKN